MEGVSTLSATQTPDKLAVLVGLVSSRPPPFGGVGVWTLRFLAAAQRHGLDVKLLEVTPPPTMQVGMGRVYHAFVKPMLRMWKRFDDCEVIHICCSAGWGLARGLALVPACLARSQAVVVHVHGSIKRSPSWLLKAAATVARMHSVALVTPSHEDARRHRFLHLIDNFVTEDFTNGAIWPGVGLGDKLRLAFMGWVVREKGIFELLDALAMVKSATLDLYGASMRPSDLDLFRRRTVDLGLTDRVRYLGMVDYRQVAEVLCGYDAVVLPTHGESFGLVACEAMCLGVPVVTTRTGFLWDAPAGVVFEIPPANGVALGQALQHIASNREHLAQVGRAGRAHVSRFHFEERVLPLWVDLYRSISGAEQHAAR